MHICAKICNFRKFYLDFYLFYHFFMRQFLIHKPKGTSTRWTPPDIIDIKQKSLLSSKEPSKLISTSAQMQMCFYHSSYNNSIQFTVIVAQLRFGGVSALDWSTSGTVIRPFLNLKPHSFNPPNTLTLLFENEFSVTRKLRNGCRILRKIRL